MIDIYTQHAINASDEGMKPGCNATVGKAKMPAPTVVPLTNAVAEMISLNELLLCVVILKDNLRFRFENFGIVEKELTGTDKNINKL